MRRLDKHVGQHSKEEIEKRYKNKRLHPRAEGGISVGGGGGCGTGTGYNDVPDDGDS